MYTLQSPSSNPEIKVSITLEGSPVEMELYIGAAYSFMSENNFRLLFPEREMASTTVHLCAYSGEAIKVLGSVDVHIKNSQHVYSYQ